MTLRAPTAAASAVGGGGAAGAAPLGEVSGAAAVEAMAEQADAAESVLTAPPGARLTSPPIPTTRRGLRGSGTTQPTPSASDHPEPHPEFAAAAAARRGRAGRGQGHDLGEGDLAGYKRAAARLDAWILFQDEAGCSLRPGKARTWSRRGRTPQVRVSGKGSGRVYLAGMIAVRPGFRTRLIYRTIAYHGRKTEKKGFRERDLAGMIDAAHQQLGRGNIVLVWDNDTNHRDAAMKKLIADRPWLTVFYLPAYAPILNPAEGLWSALKRSLPNLAPHGVDALAALVKTRLRLMQYRRDGVLDGFIAETGLALEPP
jgi:putative transposase